MALYEVYQNLLPNISSNAAKNKRFPIAFLYLQMNAKNFDINVHPTKKEVRFRDGRFVQAAICQAITDTMLKFKQKNKNKYELKNDGKNENDKILNYNYFTKINSNFKNYKNKEYDDALASEKNFTHFTQKKAPLKEQQLIDEIEPKQEQTSQQFFYIGALKRRFVLFESDDGLVIMDRRAAHQRILYENFIKNLNKKGQIHASQKLLTPELVELTPQDFSIAIELIRPLKQIGFGLEKFGNNSIKIDAIPLQLENFSLKSSDLFQQVLTQLAQETEQSKQKLAKITEKKIAACVAMNSIISKIPLDEFSMKKLLRDLLKCQMPYCCPNGKPTLIEYSYGQIEKKFGRG